MTSLIPRLSYVLWAAVASVLILGCAYYDLTVFPKEHVIQASLPQTPAIGNQELPRTLLISSAYNFGEMEWQKRVNQALAHKGVRTLSVLIPRAYNAPLETPKVFLSGLHWVRGLCDPELKTLLFLKGVNHLFKPDLLILSQAMYLPYFKGAKQAALISLDDVEPAQRFFLLDYLLFTSDRPDFCKYYVPTPQQTALLDFYPTALATPFKTLAYKKMFYCGAMWDRERRGSDTFKALYRELDERDVVQFYGPVKVWASYRNYGGLIPLEGDHFEREIQLCGIGLCLHSDLHLKSNVPTARVFELAAASALVICDELPFVKKHFGDSVLYLKTGSTEEMLLQLQAHMDWIKANPKLAQEKARRAHKIFMERFTMEQGLDRILKTWSRARP
jgi:hypothetical protein